MTTAEPARCSFCSKSHDDVYVLIAGPAVFICDECVDLSNDILMEKQRPVRWLFVAAGRAWRISLRATLRALTFGLTPRRVSPSTDSTS